MKEYRLLQQNFYPSIYRKSRSSLLKTKVESFQMLLDSCLHLVLRLDKMQYLSLNQGLNQQHKPSVVYLELNSFLSTPFNIKLISLLLSELNTTTSDENTSIDTNYLNQKMIKINVSFERILSQSGMGGQLPERATQSAIAPFNLFGFCESPLSLSKQLSLNNNFQKSNGRKLPPSLGLLVSEPYLHFLFYGEQDPYFISPPHAGYSSYTILLILESYFVRLYLPNHMQLLLINLSYFVYYCNNKINFNVLYETNKTKWEAVSSIEITLSVCITISSEMASRHLSMEVTS